MATFASIFSIVFFIYLGIGVIFAFFFITRGAGAIDEVAKDVSWWFRLIIFPGSMALWPILLIKWLRK